MRYLILLILSTCFGTLLGNASLKVAAYLNKEINVIEIGNQSDKIQAPVDLGFNPGPMREGELWVLNHGGSNGGSTVLFTNPGMQNQFSDYLRDGNSWHFMAEASAIAFGDNETFATAQAILDANRQGGTFTGPTLWSLDLDIYAKIGNPPTQQNNGSHLDMVHQSPYSSGITHEKDNIYWVNDGYNNHICRYDFKEPHYPGGHDHSDAIVYRYLELPYTRLAGIPSHMELDKTTNLLYYIDGANNRVIIADISTGTIEEEIQPMNLEPVTVKAVRNVSWSVGIDDGLGTPAGLAIKDNILAISDNSNGKIYFFDVKEGTPLKLGEIETGASSIMGIEFGPDGNIWFVDNSRNSIYKVIPNFGGSLTALEDIKLIDIDNNKAKFIFENESDSEKTLDVQVAINTSSPETWSAEVLDGKNTINVPQGSSEEIEVLINTNSTQGIGKLSIELSSSEDESYSSFTKLVTGNIPVMNINDAANANKEYFDLSEIISSEFQPIDISLSELLEISKVLNENNPGVLIWNSAAFGEIDNTEAELISDIIDNKTNLLVIGDGALFRLANSQDQNLLTRLGISAFGSIVSALNTSGRMDLSGVYPEMISMDYDNISSSLTLYNGGSNAIPSPLLVPDYINSFPVLHYKGQPDSVIALRYHNNDFRAVVLGINPVNILNITARNAIVNNSIDYLLNNDSYTKLISFTEIDYNNLEFEDIRVGETSSKNFSVINSGNQPIEILSIALEQTSNDFEISIPVDVEFPVNIGPGDDAIDIETIFTPTEVSNGLSSEVYIFSDAVNAKDEVNILILNGKSTSISSIEAFEKDDGVISIKAHPNPVKNIVNLEVTNNEISQLNGTVKIVSNTGRNVHTLDVVKLKNGINSFSFDLSSFASGKYYIFLKLDDRSVFVPIIKLN